MLTETDQAPLTYALELLGEFERCRPGRILGPGAVLRSAYRVAGPLDVAALRAAITDVVARHGALRTVVVHEGERPGQRVLPPMPGRLSVVSLPAGRTAAEFAAEVGAGHHPYDDAPLLWAHLGTYPHGGAVLVLIAHRVAADPWSMDVLARDLVTAYTARLRGRPPFAGEAMQYTDIAEDDHSDKWQARIEQALPYWRERLAGVSALGLPVRTPPPPDPPGPLAVTRFPVDEQLWRRIGVAARLARTTPFTVLLAAFVAALPPGGPGAGDALVPVVTPGRIPSECQTVGALLNVLPVRVSRCGVSGPGDLLRRVDRACRDAYANDIPLVRIMRAVPELADALTRRDRVSPAFQFVPPVPLAPGVADPALALTPAGTDGPPPPALPAALLWRMVRTDRLTGQVSYDPRLFAAEWVARRIREYRRLLHELAGPE